jgi:hypothetical protein
VFGRPVNAHGESGTRKILKPAISGNASAASSLNWTSAAPAAAITPWGLKA